MKLLPGDAIVVPEKLKVSSKMNDFLQVTQFMSQTALTAAELSAATRRRRCAGSTCSSLRRARTAVSSMPVTEPRAAVRRPDVVEWNRRQ